MFRSFPRCPRFIPTGVGNTWPGRTWSCRSCGSSPRVWGTLTVIWVRLLVKRFIPTGVGNTNRTRRLLLSSSVHPHGCGEHAGTKEDNRRYGRFIPTGVGNTLTWSSLAAPITVHPHGCGEHRERKCHGLVHGGSSPRVWGTRNHHSL